MAKSHRYMLIDGNALIHRGFHAIPGLQTKLGEPTGAVYGFTMILLRAIKDLKPTHIAATFDLAGPTFRHEQYADYKATRVKAAQELYDQIPRVKEVVRALNIPIFEKEGFEADDALGTLATLIVKKDATAHVMIVTGDMDTLQLVNDQVSVYTLRKGITDVAIYDTKAVEERFGLRPDQMIDYKALRGDPSDNIKGVKGIGEKGAAAIIQEFGSIDNLYKQLKEQKVGSLKSRVVELLLAEEANARQSFALSTIVTNMPIDFNLPAYEFTQTHLSKTVELFMQLEFKSLVDKLPKNYIANSVKGEPQETEEASPSEMPHPKPATLNPPSQDYQLVDTPEKLKRMLGKLSQDAPLAFDTETTSLDVFSGRLVGISLCGTPGAAYYIPASLVLASKALISLLKNHKQLVGHNTKFDWLVFAKEGITLSEPWFDTMIASYLLNAGSRQHNLDTLAFNELGYQMQPITDLIGKGPSRRGRARLDSVAKQAEAGKTEITMDQVPVEKVAWYAAEDADITLRLYQLFAPELEQEKVVQIFKSVEMPLVLTLAEMERNGILLDTKKLNELELEAEKRIYELEKEIHKLTSSEFNLNSPKQLKEVLFDRLGLVPVGGKKTKTGQSTAAGELEKMLGQHPVIAKMLEYRELAKLQSTYIKTLPELVNSKDKCLHTSYNQTVAATGRLSSTDPNLQNIPASSVGIAAEIRKAFVAHPGHTLLSIDYSQIELRIVAHLAGDTAMQEVFKKGLDIHTQTAIEMFGVKEKEVTKDHRRAAKAINFGILYGLSAYGLSYGVDGLNQAQAKQYIDKYFKTYPKVKEYIEQVRTEVRNNGFVRNELGRVRKFPEIKSSQFFIRAAAERAAINFPVQSLAADVMKVAMINVHREITGKKDIKMLLQVHDELVFEVLNSKLKFYAHTIAPIMETALKLDVPIAVEVKSGPNWGDIQRHTLD